MKIGIDARMYGSAFTGIGRYTYELIRHLALLDQHNTYVIFLRKESFYDFIPPNERFSKVLADFPHYSWGEQTGFLHLLSEQKLDLMHFTHFNAPLGYRRPFLVTIHDLTLSFFPGKKMTRWFHRLAYHIVIRSVTHRARAIIAVSQNTQSDLERVLKIPREKIQVIYNGIDSFFQGIPPTPQEVLFSRYRLRQPYFLYTGVWRDHKNVAGLIRAFALLKKDADQDYTLVITGKPNPLYTEVQGEIARLGLADSVRLVGLVPEEDLLALYHHALAYVFPSFYEGFGMPPLEAMSLGLPVVASSASAIPEVCGEGNALYVDPRDAQDMAGAMRRIALDPALRASLRERGLAHAARFRWADMARDVLKLYSRSNDLS